MIFAGILAGGTGSRMENSIIPKQFMKICDIPIFVRTVKTFLEIDKIDKVIVSINMDWAAKYDEQILEYGLDQNRIILTPGGQSRFESLINVANCAKELSDGEAVIVTHDCARVFVSKDIIEANIAKVNDYDMVTTSVPVIDTILYSEDGYSSNRVPDRSKLWNDQGPQTFYVDTFLKYVNMIPKKDYKYYIEAGKVYLSHGCEIGIVKGNRYNFKITNDFDLKYSEFLLREGYIE